MKLLIKLTLALAAAGCLTLGVLAQDNCYILFEYSIEEVNPDTPGKPRFQTWVNGVYHGGQSEGDIGDVTNTPGAVELKKEGLAVRKKWPEKKWRTIRWLVPCGSTALAHFKRAHGPAPRPPE